MAHPGYESIKNVEEDESDYSQEEDEDVDEDEDAGEGDDEDYDDAADHHNLSTPPDADADPNTDDADAEDEYLSTPPDADADPTEAIDAGAEDEEGNEDTAPVADILSTYYSWIPESERSDVVQLRTVAYNNAWLFFDAAEYCQTHPYGNLCVDYWNNIDSICRSTGEGCVISYDRSMLDIPTTARKVEQCERARQQATNAGFVTEPLSLAYRKLRWAPVFMTDLSDGIFEWTHCEFALTTYE